MPGGRGTNHARQIVRQSQPVLVSFSGIDGAGKTTQITALRRRLREAGSRVLLLSFWDDVAALTHIRKELSHSMFGGDRGIGCPEKPLNRQDKNVRSWYMTVARLVFYSLDTVRTNLTVAKARRSKADVVIFDRYAYDEFVNLSSPRWLTGMCLKFLLRMTPKPDIAYLLDADPRLARERKPEYPIEFLQANRAAYLALSALAGMTVINPLPPLEVSQKIMEEFRKHFSSGDAGRPSSGAQQINSSRPGGSPIRTA